jgi:leucyl/phenylalanyl-tRNA--protein transferase
MASPAITWLTAVDPFPPVDQAWGEQTSAPGLLAAGGDLNAPRLCSAYGLGIFPWFSQGQPPLWWSPDPRMVLRVKDFRLHRSFKKTLRRFQQTPGCEIRFDSAFEAVIRKCAQAPREGQNGTWILPEMVDAYCALHAKGHAHSVETWMEGRLVAGLYCVSLGRAVFGESMFSERSDGSKIALSALVAFCMHHQITQIDCQQNTRHLASLGAAPIPRAEFVASLRHTTQSAAPNWTFLPEYWELLLSHP